MFLTNIGILFVWCRGDKTRNGRRQRRIAGRPTMTMKRTTETERFARNRKLGKNFGSHQLRFRLDPISVIWHSFLFILLCSSFCFDFCRNGRRFGRQRRLFSYSPFDIETQTDRTSRSSSLIDALSSTTFPTV